jgi:hypothetical protein
MNNTVILDGVKITREQLVEKQNDKSINIILVSEGTYKTLTKMMG